MRFLPLLVLAVVGCQPGLAKQPKIPKPDSASDFFADGRANRPVVEGTIARGQLNDDPAKFTGSRDGRYVEQFPVPVTEAMVRRGRERFDIYCAVCHDMKGTGDGKIVQRGYVRPPSFHADLSRGLALRGQKVRLTDVAVGYIFDVITRGFGAMPDYATQIPVDDRWAIVAYVRALQQTAEAPNGQ